MRALEALRAVLGSGRAQEKDQSIDEKERRLREMKQRTRRLEILTELRKPGDGK